jgi:branched-chain amino acid transport system ATP-binding protein
VSLLEVIDVTKRYGPRMVLDCCSMTVERGELVGLVGPNGSGKTTLFDCVDGQQRPAAGRVLLDGRDVTDLPPQRRARLGMGRTFQRIELWAGMTVRDHLLVAGQARRHRGGLVNDVLGRGRPTAEEQVLAEQTLALLGLTDDADLPVEVLPLGRARLVELGRALMIDPVLLLLDEPSSGLDRSETAALAEVFTRIRAERRAAILMVEHDLELVRRVAERLYVLSLGQMIAHGGPTAEVLADETVKRVYVG